MLGYLSLNIICSPGLTGFLELPSGKTVPFLEQIMSMDKYSSIISRQMEAIVYLSLDKPQVIWLVYFRTTQKLVLCALQISKSP